jgi:hypothetical protein
MTASSPILRAALATASAAALALSVTLPAGGAAFADSPEPTGSATTSTTYPAEPTETKTTERTGKPRDPDDPPGQLEDPAPAAPQPQLLSTPAPAAPTVVPGPSEPADAGAPDSAGTSSPSETGTPASVAPSTAGPSSESNWNKPVTRAAKATQAAAMTRPGSEGPGGPNLPAITAGVLLVGLGGGVFTWWGRNRLRAH